MKTEGLLHLRVSCKGEVQPMMSPNTSWAQYPVMTSIHMRHGTQYQVRSNIKLHVQPQKIIPGLSPASKQGCLFKKRMCGT